MDSNQVLREWAERSGAYSPDYYAYYGPNDTSEAIRATLDDVVDEDANVLELGCSSGRHLAYLYEHGYENLSGVDVNSESFDVMAEAYPELADEGTFYVDAIETVVRDFDDGQFDVVYSVETLQHLHPDHESVFAKLAQIVDELLITVENEGTPEDRQSDGPAVNYVDDDFPLYYRRWDEIFGGDSLVEIDSKPLDRDTFRAFRPADAASR